ncbi:MAG: endonuclease NucS [Thermoprotei archaeon]|nr:endonuclease NucS [Thermoprotei archaeon]
MQVHSLVPNNLAEARDFIARGLEKKSWIIVTALCKASYEGRGSSEATVGDRVLMIKPDGSLIVHGPRGFKPLNWQPETSSISVSLEGDSVVLRAVRRHPREVLVLECAQIYSIAIGVSPEEGQFWMYMSEAELRDAIALNPRDILGEDIRIVDIEKPVEPGFVDLYGKDGEGNIVVIEVKRVRAGEEAARQLIAYVESLRARGVKVRGILVAPGVTENAIKLLYAAGLEYRVVDIKKIYRKYSKRKMRERILTDYM